MNSTIYFFIAVAIIICVAIFTLIFEKKTRWEGNDERQILISLKSSTIGFITLIFLNLFSFLVTRTFELPFKSELLILFSVLISFTIFIAREIWFDNIHSNVLNGKRIFVLITLLLAIMVTRFFKAYFTGSHAIENLLIASSVSLCYVICIVTIVIRKIKDSESGENN